MATPMPDTRTGQRPGRALIGGAIGWGIVLMILAVTLPIETVNTGRAGVQPMHSLVAVHGYIALLPAGIPLLIAIIVGILLAGPRGARWSVTVAWIFSVALLIAALVGFVTFLIGIFAVPTGALLVGATAMQSSRRPAAAAVSVPGNLH
jgi:hypothetical protein